MSTRTLVAGECAQAMPKSWGAKSLIYEATRVAEKWSTKMIGAK